MTIRDAWKVYLEKIAEGNKLCAEGDKLCAEDDKLCAEGDKLCAECDKLYAECDKLCAEARASFFQVVLDNLGNVIVDWKEYWYEVEIAGVFYTNNLEDAWNKQDTCDGKVVEIDGRKYQLKLV